MTTQDKAELAQLLLDAAHANARLVQGLHTLRCADELAAANISALRLASAAGDVADWSWAAYRRGACL